MNTRLEYYGVVNEEGILKLTNRTGFAQDLHDFIGKEVRITVERKAKRSNQQNRFFHGVVLPIIKSHMVDHGWKEAKSSEWVKDYVKFHCLVKEVVNEDTGECEKTLGKTSELSTSEFKDMIADVQQFCAEKWDLYIPDPGEQMLLDIK